MSATKVDKEECMRPSNFVPNLTDEDIKAIKDRDALLKRTCREYCNKVAEECTKSSGGELLSLFFLALTILWSIDVVFGHISLDVFITDTAYAMILSIFVVFVISYMEFKDIYDFCYDVCLDEIKKKVR